MAEDEESEIIARLRDQFEERCETLDGLILQTRDEWLGIRKGEGVHGKWKNDPAELFDPEIGFEVPHWKEIPYINKSTSENLVEELELVRELQGNLKRKFANNEYDLSFTRSWGLFCGVIGSLETLLNAKPEKHSTARTVASGHTQEDKRAQKLWYSLLFLELKKDPELIGRAAIDDAIVETINYCIEVDFGKEDGFGKNWFRLLLGDPKKKLDHHLASAFGDKKFWISDIEKAARHRAYKIPTIKGLKRLKRH